MFDVTYLGHQGWLVESGDSRILLDPLLGSGVGNMVEDGLDVFPPRELDLEAFPPVSAVVVSHEHSDHLSIPSLLRLDRRIPVYLPARASAAARGLLRDLGFTAHLIRSGDRHAVGSLEIHPFHAAEVTRDEWDVMPVVIRDAQGHGSLATSIDAPESDEFTRFAAARAGRVGLWSTSHNQIDLFAVDGRRQASDAEVTRRLADQMTSRVQEGFRQAAAPAVVAVLSSGFTFKDDLAWMNPHVFPGAPGRIAALMSTSVRGSAVRAPVPGQTFSFTGSELTGEAPARTFLRTPDARTWPAHAADPHEGPVPDYAPACGTRDFSREDLEALLAELRGFAAHLYGSSLFRALYTRADGPGLAPDREIGFALRAASGDLTLAYRPEACAFELVPSRGREALAVGMECWASDLLAALRLDLFPGYLLVGRYRRWSRTDHELPSHLDGELAMYGHPLRHPERTLEAYRRAARGLTVGAPEARIRFASS